MCSYMKFRNTSSFCYFPLFMSLVFSRAVQRALRSIHRGKLQGNTRFLTRSLLVSARKMANSNNGSGDKMKENRLANERSPYLLQHKNNPVDW